MATLKRYSLPLLLLFITGVLLATMAWHHAHCGSMTPAIQFTAGRLGDVK